MIFYVLVEGGEEEVDEEGEVVIWLWFSLLLVEEEGYFCVLVEGYVYYFCFWVGLIWFDLIWVNKGRLGREIEGLGRERKLVGWEMWNGKWLGWKFGRVVVRNYGK